MVHEVMINLYQGGGIYGYTGSVTQEFQNWAADAFAGQTGDIDPFAGSHYLLLCPDGGPDQQSFRWTGRSRRLLDADVRRLCRGYLEADPKLTLNLGDAL